MTLLLGDETTTYTDTPLNITNGDIWAFQFTAVASGTIDTLEIYATDDELYTDHVHLFLAVYSDSADTPDALIGNVVTWTGTPTGNTWLGGTGAAAAVSVGQTYWLAGMSYGDAGPGNAGPVGVNLAHGNDELGTNAVRNDDESHSTIPSTWPGTSVSDTIGPLGFRALGSAAAPTPITGLVWQVAGLWYPDATSVDFYGTIADPQNGKVVIPLDDSRTAEVTLSVDDPIVKQLRGHTYARSLKCYYHGILVFWGVVKLVTLNQAENSEPRTITISAVDPSIRAIRHFLRRDDLDGDLSAASQDRANVSIDHIGLRKVLDAARNIPGQTARGCPDIGIDVGTNDFVADPTSLMGVSRGDQVWDTILQLSQTLGPDFELEPVDNVVGAYCKLNTYTVQGSDKTASLQLHYGGNRDNVEDIEITEGSQYVTHVHVLSRDLTYRFTRVNVESSAETGQYTDWDATDYDSHGIDPAKVEDVLDAYGDDVLKAYGRPLIEVTLKMPVEDDTSYLYGTDYAVGDIASVAVQDGQFDLPEDGYRIIQVTLNQEDETNAVRPDIQVIADRTTGDTLEDSGGE